MVRLGSGCAAGAVGGVEPEHSGPGEQPGQLELHPKDSVQAVGQRFHHIQLARTAVLGEHKLHSRWEQLRRLHRRLVSTSSHDCLDMSKSKCWLPV